MSVRSSNDDTNHDDDNDDNSSNNNKRRRVDNEDKAHHHEHDNAVTVASHYNALPNKGLSEYKNSAIYALKTLNNWTKALLIQQYVRKGQDVLELAGGKGGDLPKYDKARVNFVCLVDIASKSIEEAQRRYRERRSSFAAQFIVADCFQVDISASLRSLSTKTPVLFDTVSCQMAFHYCFEQERKARAMLHNIAQSLKPNGHFIATIPDYNAIRRLLSDRMKYSNSVCSIEYDYFPTYGARYRFNLEDAINDCPEYLVHKETLVKLASEYRLKLKLCENFNRFYEAHRNDDNARKLWDIIKVPPPNSIHADQWTTYGIYSVWVFVREEGSLPAPTVFTPSHATEQNGIITCHLNTSNSSRVPSSVSASSSSASTTTTNTNTNTKSAASMAADYDRGSHRKRTGLGYTSPTNNNNNNNNDGDDTSAV